MRITLTTHSTTDSLPLEEEDEDGNSTGSF